jgi:diguanylate cyclase (GGDEF)-like protein
MGSFSAETDSASLDALTGLLNQHSLQEVLRREVVRATRYRRPLALVLFDVNDFKDVNARHGHVEGDRVLGRLAERVRQVVRPNAFAFRLEGDEFAVLLPQASRQRAEDFAARLNSLLKSRTISSSANLALSFGFVQLEHGEDSASFLARADLALQDGKRGSGSPPSGARERRRESA